MTSYETEERTLQEQTELIRQDNATLRDQIRDIAR
jgi:hypothetical protein